MDEKTDCDREYDRAMRRLLSARCSVCRNAPADITESTLGMWHGGAWYCFNCVETLFRTLGVRDGHEYYVKFPY